MRLGVCILLLLSFSSTVFAMRCGTDLVLKGDSDISVLDRCGEPLLVTKLKVPCVGRDDGCDVERWAYRKGTKHYSMVYISGGRVTDVKTEAK